MLEVNYLKTTFKNYILVCKQFLVNNIKFTLLHRFKPIFFLIESTRRQKSIQKTPTSSNKNWKRSRRPGKFHLLYFGHDHLDPNGVVQLLNRLAWTSLLRSHGATRISFYMREVWTEVNSKRNAKKFVFKQVICRGVFQNQVGVTC